MNTIKKYNVLKNVTAVSVALFTILFAVNVYSQISKEDATRIVLNDILHNDTQGKNIYISKSPIPANTKIKCLNREYTLPNKGWFFYIDCDPMAYWCHPIKLIHIDYQSGEYEIINENFNKSWLNAKTSEAIIF